MGDEHDSNLAAGTYPVHTLGNHFQGVDVESESVSSRTANFGFSNPI